MKPEASFATEFKLAINKRKWLWIVIPDVIVTKELLENATYRGRVASRKLPCDGLVVTPNGIVMVELKAGSNPAKEHQKKNCQAVNMMCAGRYLFIRKNRDNYTVEYIPFVGSKAVLLKTKTLDDVMTYIDMASRAQMIIDKVKEVSK